MSEVVLNKSGECLRSLSKSGEGICGWPGSGRAALGNINTINTIDVSRHEFLPKLHYIRYGYIDEHDFDVRGKRKSE